MGSLDEGARPPTSERLAAAGLADITFGQRAEDAAAAQLAEAAKKPLRLEIRCKHTVRSSGLFAEVRGDLIVIGVWVHSLDASEPLAGRCGTCSAEFDLSVTAIHQELKKRRRVVLVEDVGRRVEPHT